MKREWALCPATHVHNDDGPLMVLEGSHRLDCLKQTYGTLDVDRDNVDGSFSDDPLELLELFGGRWLTTEYEPGDVLILSMYLLHASTRNTSGHFRISCDTRFQRANQPIDERWIGENPIGHYAWGKMPTLPMAEKRREWGI